MKHAPLLAAALLTSILVSPRLASAATPHRLDLDVKDAELHNVFRLLADVGKVNIVVPDDVKGRLTLKLSQVPWSQALEVVLRSKGLGVEKNGNIYYVDTLERMTARAEAEARIQAAQVAAAPLRTVFIPVHYAKASELASIVKSMLTERGSVQVDARTNTLIVTDVSESVGRVSQTVGR